MDSYIVELMTWLSRGLNINLRWLNRYVPYGGALFGSGESPLSHVCHDYYQRGWLEHPFYRSTPPCRVCNFVRWLTNLVDESHIEKSRDDRLDIVRKL